MPLELVTIPCLADNYAFLLHDPETGDTALFDAPEAAPVLAALESREWRLTDIFLTHHHGDHIDGVAAIRAATGARVAGAAADAHRLPSLDRALKEGDIVTVGTEAGHVIDVPGHTVGHIAFHFPESGLAFTGDSLMAGGCGRLFEGTPAQMWDSLSKLAALPASTRICSGHEYTQSNLRFALTVDSTNPALAARMMRVVKARAEGRATVPSRLSGELATNPFLRASDPHIRRTLGLDGASDQEVFAELRAMKNRF
ncbi:hydroxyacylglutathione hydrolase [Aliigemmobacter aestuarii]|uniref:Hydroxyacylglutathione hydrolase n=1 Tax=Aliigemmobacter aestuarii TaxID=1445661 RepID=A0A4S3MR26_9RHOB|nr:hydroxyacylglutathione hydrolase [Gemmobacter aestuarii]THD84966.1 hydroxyacylglutathione hydrolase [Gemmobacter aestuarii]